MQHEEYTNKHSGFIINSSENKLEKVNNKILKIFIIIVI
jgi:hypothetical protein